MTEGADIEIRNILLKDENKARLDDMIKSDIKHIDDTMHAMNKLLSETASQCLKSTSGRKKTTKSKPWFNLNCNKLKTELRSLAKSLCKDPKNVQLRATFFTSKRSYKNIIKNTKSDFKQKLLQELEHASVNNSSQYWKTLEKLRGADKITSDNPISHEEWVSHFTDLFRAPLKDGSQDETSILAELKYYESNPIFNELSFAFTLDEISKAISKLKLKKSPGLDGISGEIIKASAPFIGPIFLILF